MKSNELNCDESNEALRDGSHSMSKSSKFKGELGTGDLATGDGIMLPGDEGNASWDPCSEKSIDEKSKSPKVSSKNPSPGKKKSDSVGGGDTSLRN